MAKKIYIGEILKQVNDAIADLQTDMGTMSTDMASMVSELIALKDTMGQGLSSINAMASSNNKITTTVDISKPVTIDIAYQTIMTCNSKIDGTIKFDGVWEFNASAPTYANKLGYSLDGGVTWTDLVSKSSVTGVNTVTIADKIISITSSTVLLIGVHTSNHSVNTDHKILSGSTFSYDIIDLVNDGGLIVS